MKTRSKLLLMLLVLVLTFALVACGGEKTPALDGTENAEGTKAPEATNTPQGGTSAPEATKAPAATKAPEATKTPEVTKAPVTTAAPETEAPVVYKDPFEDTKYKAEDYYALYVSDGLLLHLNFATANEGTAPIVGGDSYNNPEVSATKRFTGVASSYNPFVVYSTVEDPVNGGTAQLLTPWYFENWYKDGFFNDHTVGNGKIEDMQTEEPLEFAKMAARNGTDIYVRNTNMYHTDYYYTDGTWTRQTYVSYWGNGCFGIGKNGILNVGQKLAKELASGYTVDVAFSGPTFYYYVGGRIYLSNKDGAYNAYLAEGNYIKEAFPSIHLQNTMIGAVNTISLTVQPTEDSKATFNFYGNGEGFGGHTLTIGDIESLHQYCSGTSDTNLYATRIYNRPLTAEEVSQNHFADVAIVNKLDIEAFLKLDDAGKLKVYEAFKGEIVDSGYDYLQPILDAAVK